MLYSWLVVYQTKNTAREIRQKNYLAHFIRLFVLQKIASFKVSATLLQSHLHYP